MRLCEDALVSGLVPSILILRSDKVALWDAWCEKYASLKDAEVLVFSEDLFSRLSSTVNPQGVAMVVDAPVYPDNGIKAEGRCRYIVLEHLQDPGNMGTIIRMADAFAFDAVIFTEDSVDPFNEKVLRASMGSCFHIPLISMSGSEKILALLKENSISSIGAHLHGNALQGAVFPDRAALWIGNEANGLTDSTSSQCDILVKIEMKGKAESLNAASAASILGYLLSVS
ncbi:MAG: RNA methyltransferase [Clostridiales bacterium]|nr:RNA methyltransferase [Clostridiales bacterium]